MFKMMMGLCAAVFLVGCNQGNDVAFVDFQSREIRMVTGDGRVSVCGRDRSSDELKLVCTPWAQPENKQAQ
ncbi:hypothetical protein A3754_01940 [Alcanivorax sp. HI0083]|nr:hypothetical protein A3730_13025 [Alcanivorax sp. HI0044]KZZ25950.1 hypothetical protein A3754_01940 [Alcanivorax sp. HI0083]